MITDRIRSRSIAGRGFAWPGGSLRLALGLALWAVAWLAMLSFTALSPPVDNVEQLTWVRAAEWGYYKHPPLPTLLLWPWVQLFGVDEWVSYIAGALTTCGAIVIAWKLVTELAGRHLALLATLGTLCISYYNGRLYYYNHNTVLMLAVVGAAWFGWRAFAARSLGAWIGAGVMLGLGALTKYQIALAALSLFGFWLVQCGWRDRLHRRGLALAVGVAALVFSPHLAWLVAHDFQPIHYAVGSSLGRDLSPLARSLDTLRWIGDQLNRLSPALLLGAGLLLWTRRAPAPAQAPTHAQVQTLVEVPAQAQVQSQAQASVDIALRDGAAAFLFCWGALPLLTMALLGVASGADLQFQWGTAFMPLTCAWLIERSGAARWRRVTARQALVGFIAVQLLLAALNWATSPVGIPRLMKHHSRSFPSQAVADRLAPAAQAAQRGPIRVIAGPPSLAGVLALRLPERPLVLINGDLAISPWVPPDLAARCGVLWVGFAGDRTIAAADRHPLSDGLWWAFASPRPGAGACRH